MFVRADCTVGSSTFNNLGLHKNMTVDLNNHTLTFTASSGIRPTTDSSNGNSTEIRISFKNGYLVMSGTSSFLLYPNGTASKSAGTTTYLSFENVKFSKASGASATAPFVTTNNFSVNANINVAYTDCTFNLDSIDYSSSALTLFKAGDSAGYVTASVTVSGGSIVTNQCEGLTLSASVNSKSSVIFTRGSDGAYTTLTVSEAGCASVPEIAVATDGGSRIFGMTSLSDGVGIFEPCFTEDDLTLVGYSVKLAPVYASKNLYPVIYLTASNGVYTFAKASTTLFSSVSGMNDEVSLRNAEACAVILRRDYEFTNAANNLGFHGNVTFDLGGNTLTCSSYHNLRPTSGSGGSEKQFTFKNGTVLLNRSSLIEINSHASMNGTVSDILFDGISFVYASGSVQTVSPIKYGSSFAGSCKVNVTFKDCIFDLTESVNRKTLFTAGSGDGAVSGTVTVLGGEIIANDASAFTLTSVYDESSTVLFGEGTEGYTLLTLEGGDAPDGRYTSVNGKRLAFVQHGSGKYKLAVIFLFVEAGLNLTNDINVIWKAQIPEGYSEIYATFKLGDNEAVTVYDYTIDENGYYCFTFRNITPDRMIDIISASIYADGELKATKPDFSIKSYCKYLLDNYSTDAKLVALVSDLLIYGERAQLYVGYKTDNLVTDGLNLSASACPEITEDFNKLTLSVDKADGIAFEGIGLVLDSSLAFRLCFSAEDTEGLTVKVSIGGRSASFEVSALADGKGKYMLIYDGINATQFDETITVSFLRNGEALSTSITYSVNSYAYYIHSIEAEDKLVAIVEAITCYGASAVSYSKSNS